MLFEILEFMWLLEVVLIIVILIFVLEILLDNMLFDVDGNLYFLLGLICIINL